MTDQETIIREWLEKAYSDYRSAEILLQSNEPVANDSVCFLCQQCIEKLLKAVIIQQNLRPPKSHDLVALAAQVSGFLPDILLDEIALDELTRYAVEFRYPGYKASRSDAESAFTCCTQLQDTLLKQFD